MVRKADGSATACAGRRGQAWDGAVGALLLARHQFARLALVLELDQWFHLAPRLAAGPMGNVTGRDFPYQNPPRLWRLVSNATKHAALTVACFTRVTAANFSCCAKRYSFCVMIAFDAPELNFFRLSVTSWVFERNTAIFGATIQREYRHQEVRYVRITGNGSAEADKSSRHTGERLLSSSSVRLEVE